MNLFFHQQQRDIVVLFFSLTWVFFHFCGSSEYTCFFVGLSLNWIGPFFSVTFVQHVKCSWEVSYSFFWRVGGETTFSCRCGRGCHWFQLLCISSHGICPRWRQLPPDSCPREKHVFFCTHHHVSGFFSRQFSACFSSSSSKLVKRTFCLLRKYPEWKSWPTVHWRLRLHSPLASRGFNGTLKLSYSLRRFCNSLECVSFVSLLYCFCYGRRAILRLLQHTQAFEL